MTRTPTFRVTGMHCPACEFLVADEVGTDPTVASASATRAGWLKVELHDEQEPSELKARWNAKLDPLGYRLYLEDENPSRETLKETLTGLALGAVFLSAFALLQVSGVVNLWAPESLGLTGSFVLGLLASVSSCFALVGGLLVSYTAAVGRRNPRAVGSGLMAFHASRLAVFFVGGGLLGLLGGILGTFSDLPSVLLTVAALVMTGLGLSLLGVRWPGRRSGRAVGRAQGWAAWGTGAGGALLGAATFVLPCGFTQSVQFQALAAGGFLEGASLTLAFAVGTLPVLASVGWLLGHGLAGRRRAVLLKAGGAVVLGLGLFQLWGALHVWGIAFST